MTKSARISYVFVLLTLALAGLMGLETPLLAILFSYFALQKLSFGRSSVLALLLFFILVAGVGYGFFHFFNQALHATPKIADNTLKAIGRMAEQRQWELPLATQWETFLPQAREFVMEQIGFLSKGATILGKQLVLLLIGMVVAVGLFLSVRVVLENPQSPKNNLYSIISAEVIERFRTFYQSFATVMGAQIVISAINTLLTGLFVFSVSLPYAGLMLAVTFFAGLLPIIGNLISNTVIVSVALTVSPNLGLAALIFLVVLHKLEYFLNSKIIGERIRNPMWLTLLGLVVGERLMGIPGMILAPVFLHYIRIETSKIPVGVTEPSQVEPASRVEGEAA